MKEERGITLINLIIIVIILLIIITLSFSGIKNAYQNSQINKYVYKMQKIQEEVNSIRSNYKLWNEYDPNVAGNFYSYLQSLGFSPANSSSNLYLDEFKQIITRLNENSLEDWNQNTDSIIANYYYFSPEDLKKYFNFKDIDMNIIINFYSGNVISKEGVLEDEIIIHRQYDSKFGTRLVTLPIYNGDKKVNIEVLENHGLSQKVKISLEQKDKSDILSIYYYSDNSETKRLCNNLKSYSYNEEEKAAYFDVNTSGKYTFIIEDTNYVQYPKIEYEFHLCNPPILYEGMTGIYWNENGKEKMISQEYDSNWYDYTNLKMANAKTEDGNYWVWIPRYLYNETPEGIDIKFVNGTTDIPTNNRALTSYKVQDVFLEGEEISGFWISKFQAKCENNKIEIQPGNALSLSKIPKVSNYIKFFSINIRDCVNIMSEKDKEAVLLFTKQKELTISNDVVHYAGGSPNVDGFKENIQYSSTNNIYGVYDLLTSENEIFKESNINEEGRFRFTIKK